MSYEIPGFSFTLPAGVDLSASEFCGVTTDVNGLANLPTAAGGRIVGALNNKPKLGESATIVNTGIAQMVSGAAIPLVAGGTPVQVDAQGRVIPLAAGFYVGVALEASSGVGIIVAVLLGVNHG